MRRPLPKFLAHKKMFLHERSLQKQKVMRYSKTKPWRNITLTHGFRFVFNSGASFKVGRNQFALVASNRHCHLKKTKTIRECDRFQLLQLDTGNGNIMQPIDVERLVNGENPIDPWYANFSAEKKAQIDAAVMQKTGQSTFILTSYNCPYPAVEEYDVATVMGGAVVHSTISIPILTS
jgi:hypothetical protein